jgi:5'-methylthioadenosine phosphorylase
MYPINLSLITDYDCGVDGIPPVSHEEVLAVFKENTERLKQLLFRLVALVPATRPEADFVPHVR